jgi:metal-dependent hydrolase (beta-lactamase superfamily II)
MGKTDAFAENAEKLGIDLASVDTAILSHGHNDHGGGMETFLRCNTCAPLYVTPRAFEPHYNRFGSYIGLDAALQTSPRLVFTEEECSLGENLTLYSCNSRLRPFGTDTGGLQVEEQRLLLPEDFRHEQYLMLEEEGFRVLLSGCSHRGIRNGAEEFRADVIVGGFHTSKLPDGELLTETAQEDGQAILFLNRRGYHRFVSCRSCGQAVTCERCSVAMTYHTRRGSYTEGELVCHFCGGRKPLPKVCPECSSEHLARGGFGTQRVEQELGELFPSARVLRMDTDTTTSKFSYDRMLGEFRAHEADILLGTQMVTKGHDFPDVTLVGVLSADASLYLDDYRAGERTFAQLTQVIGRAGRGNTPGRAIIQTANPDNDIIRLACAQDYESFYAREIQLRRLLVFPPFCDIALLSLSCEDEKALMLAARRLYEETNKLIKGDYSDVQTVIFGPFEAPVYRVDNKFRMRMVVKCRLNKRSRALFAELLTTFSSGGSSGAVLSVDFNPSTL